MLLSTLMFDFVCILIIEIDLDSCKTNYAFLLLHQMQNFSDVSGLDDHASMNWHRRWASGGTVLHGANSFPCN